MNVIAEIEAVAAKYEGEAKAFLQGLVAKLHGDKATLMAELDAEIAKGSEEAKTLWVKLKALI